MAFLIGCLVGGVSFWAFNKFVLPKVKGKIAEWVK